VLPPELLAPARRSWSLQTPEKRLLLHELARLVTPVVKRTITRASEARGLGSTPGWGTERSQAGKPDLRTGGRVEGRRRVDVPGAPGRPAGAANLPACDSGVAASLRPPVSAILGVCRAAHDRAEVEYQVRFRARTVRGPSACWCH